jgi:hypothetical protein
MKEKDIKREFIQLMNNDGLFIINPIKLNWIGGEESQGTMSLLRIEMKTASGTIMRIEW